MASRKPLQAKNHSRRSFLRSVAVGGAVITGGVGQLSTVGAQTVETPSIPAQFTTEEWERRDLGQKDSNGFSWNGVALRNVDLSESVESEVGYSDPLWRLYTWKLDAPREDYVDSESSNDGDGWFGWGLESVSAGINTIVFASVQLKNLDEGSDGVNTERGKKALAVFGNQVEADYPFTSVKSCEGLNKDEWGDCGSPTAVSYSTPTATVEEKYTIRKEHSTEKYDVDYRGFFVLQTFDEGESFVISGAVFPDSKVNRTWPKSDYVFEKDFIDKSRTFIKEAGSSP